MKNSTADVQLVKELFRSLPELPGSQAPGMREWQIVLSLVQKALMVSNIFKKKHIFYVKTVLNECKVSVMSALSQSQVSIDC